LDHVYGIIESGFEGLKGIASIGFSTEPNASKEKANFRLLIYRFKGDLINKRCLHREK
jgi:hypothetical protein